MLFVGIELARRGTETNPSICGMGPHSASCPETPLCQLWWFFSM